MYFVPHFAHTKVSSYWIAHQKQFSPFQDGDYDAIDLYDDVITTPSNNEPMGDVAPHVSRNVFGSIYV